MRHRKRAGIAFAALLVAALAVVAGGVRARRRRRHAPDLGDEQRRASGRGHGADRPAVRAQTGDQVDVAARRLGRPVPADHERGAVGQSPDITQAGTTQVAYFAALNGFDNLAGPRRPDRRQGGVPGRRVDDHPGRRQARRVVRAVVLGGADDLLPDRHLQAGGHRPGEAFRTWDSFRGDAPAAQPRSSTIERPAHLPARPAGQDRLGPRPPRDAVRVGRGRVASSRRTPALDDRRAARGHRREVLRRPREQGLRHAGRARDERAAGREPVQGRAARHVDRRPVGRRRGGAQ